MTSRSSSRPTSYVSASSKPHGRRATTDFTTHVPGADAVPGRYWTRARSRATLIVWSKVLCHTNAMQNRAEKADGNRALAMPLNGTDQNGERCCHGRRARVFASSSVFSAGHCEGSEGRRESDRAQATKPWKDKPRQQGSNGTNERGRTSTRTRLPPPHRGPQ